MMTYCISVVTNGFPQSVKEMIHNEATLQCASVQ